MEQCLKILKINMVQHHQLQHGFPRIHGLVYDIRTGELKELDIDVRGYRTCVASRASTSYTRSPPTTCP